MKNIIVKNIYVYRFVDNKYIDVFEADIINKEFSEDGNFIIKDPKEWNVKSKNVFINYHKCLLNSSGKNSTDSKLITCECGVSYNNVLWLHEYDISKAVEIFKRHNNDKIEEYNKLISKLEECNNHLDKYKS